MGARSPIRTPRHPEMASKAIAAAAQTKIVHDAGAIPACIPTLASENWAPQIAPIANM